jgi:hypothetical protein
MGQIVDPRQIEENKGGERSRFHMEPTASQNNWTAMSKALDISTRSQTCRLVTAPLSLSTKTQSASCPNIDARFQANSTSESAGSSGNPDCEYFVFTSPTTPPRSLVEPTPSSLPS